MANGGNVITARRTLSILYGPDRCGRSVGEPDHEHRAGLLRGVGVDRAVLLGILAWAWPDGGAHATNMLHILVLLWSTTDVWTPAAPELHERPDPASTTALSLGPSLSP